MSQLDDILSQTANDISLGVVTGEWKQSHTKPQIQALVKELNLTDEQIERAKQLGLWDE